MRESCGNMKDKKNIDIIFVINSIEKKTASINHFHEWRNE